MLRLSNGRKKFGPENPVRQSRDCWNSSAEVGLCGLKFENILVVFTCDRVTPNNNYFIDIKATGVVHPNISEDEDEIRTANNKIRMTYELVNNYKADIQSG